MTSLAFILGNVPLALSTGAGSNSRSEMGIAVVFGVLVLVLWWALYPVLSRAFSKGKDSGRVRWTLTEEQLTIGDDVICLDTVKTVHCWTNRSALGTADGGLTVNIETSGKNRVLRSLRAGEEAAESERLLRELVTALGYGARLPEQ